MQGLERIVWIDGDFALKTVNFECNHTGLPSLHICEVLLCPDNVLQLTPDEDTAQEPVEGRHHPTAGAAGQHAGPTQLVKCFTGQRDGNGCSPQSLGEDP